MPLRLPGGTWLRFQFQQGAVPRADARGSGAEGRGSLPGATDGLRFLEAPGLAWQARRARLWLLTVCQTQRGSMRCVGGLDESDGCTGWRCLMSHFPRDVLSVPNAATAGREVAIRLAWRSL